MQAEKLYSRESSWIATIAYTCTDAKENRTNIPRTREHLIIDFSEVGAYENARGYDTWRDGPGSRNTSFGDSNTYAQRRRRSNFP